jgi:hypothetical protein
MGMKPMGVAPSGCCPVGVGGPAGVGAPARRRAEARPDYRSISGTAYLHGGRWGP